MKKDFSAFQKLANSNFGSSQRNKYVRRHHLRSNNKIQINNSKVSNNQDKWEQWEESIHKIFMLLQILRKAKVAQVINESLFTVTCINNLNITREKRADTH